MNLRDLCRHRNGTLYPLTVEPLLGGSHFTWEGCESCRLLVVEYVRLSGKFRLVVQRGQDETPGTRQFRAKLVSSSEESGGAPEFHSESWSAPRKVTMARRSMRVTRGSKRVTTSHVFDLPDGYVRRGDQIRSPFRAAQA